MEKSVAPTMKNISKHLTKVLTKAIDVGLGIPNFPAVVQWASAGSSDLSSPSALKIFNMYSKKEGFSHKSSLEIAEEIVKNIPKEPLIKEIKITPLITGEPKKPAKEVKETTEVKVAKEGEKPEDKKKDAKPKKEKEPAPPSYYIDFILNEDYLTETASGVLSNGIVLDTQEIKHTKVLVDFSSPNIAKEMHVGHLRSTIIGESICRVLEFLGLEVMRINHVGDWGTQFGMLIANLQEVYPDYLVNKPELTEIEAFYVASKKRFDNEPDFKKKAYEATVKLQIGEAEYREAWKFICEVSRNEYEKIYKLLDITLTEVGESFYDPISRELIPKLEADNKVVLHEGAKIMKLDGIKVPMMIVKSDGGFTYDTSDLTAVVYRLDTLKRDWIIYVIGLEQSDHLKSLFQAAKQLGYHNGVTTRLDHAGFGMMLNETGGKISTREGGLVKLIDLLNTAKDESKKELIKRSQEVGIAFTEDELEISAGKIGYSAIRYFDLKQTRETNYKFSYKAMLDAKGNTAVYLFYNYVRICSIYRKLSLTQEDINKLAQSDKIIITHEKERSLLLSLLKFNDVIDEVISTIAINKIADYVYIICTKFSEFFDECRIKDSEHEKSRLLLVELTKKYLTVGFHLLGLTPVDKI